MIPLESIGQRTTAGTRKASSRGRATPALAALLVAVCAASALAKPVAPDLGDAGSADDFMLVSAEAAELRLDFATRPGSTVIGITSTAPLTSHTVYDQDPTTIVVEVPGADVADLPAVATVGSPEVSEVRVEVTGANSGLPSAHFLIKRAPGARRDVALSPKNPRRLEITVTGPVTTDGAAAAAATSATVLAAPAAPTPAPARTSAVAAARPTTGLSIDGPAATPRLTATSSTPDSMASPAVPKSGSPAIPKAGASPAPPARSPSAATLTASSPASYSSAPQHAAETVEAEPIARSPRAVAPAPVAPTAPPRLGSPQEESPGPARLLEATCSRSDDGRAVLRLVGSKHLTAQLLVLENPPRLAIDLVDTVNAASRTSLPVRDAGVLGVRVAQNQPLPEPVTRIVLDLERPMPYELVPGPNALAVVLGEGRSLASAVAQSWPQRDEPASSADPGLVIAPAWTAETAANLGRPTMLSGAPAPAMLPMRETAGALPAVRSARDAAGSMSSSAAIAGSSSVISGSGEGRSPFAFETIALAGEEPVYVGDPISINFKDADLQELFRLFKLVSGLNIIVDPAVKGKTITIALDNVPWDQALAMVLKTQGLGSTLEGNILRIAPLTKLAQEENQKKSLAEAKELAGDLKSIARTLSYASGTAAQTIVKKTLSSRGDVTLDQRTNTLIIDDVAPRIEKVQALLDLLDKPTRQVMIESRIVETQKTFSKALGINWNVNYIADRNFGNSTGYSFPRAGSADYAVNLPTASFGTFGLSFRNLLNTFSLDLSITALESQGRGRVISAPRVMVQNNEEAEIESGVQIPITTTTATEVDVTFVSASLKLTVRPQITADDTIIMDVEVDNNSPTFLGGGDTPSINTRTAQTVVAVPNGGTTVIGGIYQVNEGANAGRVPFLSRLPLLGWLFRNKTVRRENNELLIFLTPKIQE